MRRLALAVLLVACGGEIDAAPAPTRPECATLRTCLTCSPNDHCAWCPATQTCFAVSTQYECSRPLTFSEFCPL